LRMDIWIFYPYIFQDVNCEKLTACFNKNLRVWKILLVKNVIKLTELKMRDISQIKL
jgi:hypothetical protein